jgi:nucleoside-diphosphate-sugar epimerase
MKKIGIFGGTGFIGNRFCELYNQQSIKIDRAEYKHKSSESLYFISTVDNYNVHKDLHIDIDTNLTVLMSVLENIDRSNKDFVFNFVSSWFVYGKNEIIPFNEEKSICNPTGFYSITKRCAEQLIISFCETFDIKYRIFRLANVLGEQDYKISKKKNALQYIIKQIANNEDVDLYNAGATVRDYIYVDDVCKALMCCIDNAPVNEIINIANGEPYLLSKAVELAVQLSQSTSKINNIEPPHFHKVVQVKNSYLDITKLKSYGFKSEYSIESMVEKLVRYYKKK